MSYKLPISELAVLAVVLPSTAFSAQTLLTCPEQFSTPNTLNRVPEGWTSFSP